MGRRPGRRSRAEPARACLRLAAPPAPACSSRCCWRGRWAGWSSPTSARSRSCSSPRSGTWTRSRGEVVKDYSLAELPRRSEGDVYRTIALRTVAIAAAVTVTDALLAFPIAFYMAKVASPRTRALLVVAVLMPLWSSYLVKVYAWRTILSEEGILNWALDRSGSAGPGFGNVATWLVFTYLWLPFMILPDLRRARADPELAARRVRRPRRRPRAHVPPRVLPLALPGGRRRLDLHVLADARRLHHAAARLEHAVHRQRRLRERRRREQPAARRGVRDGAGGRS